MWWNGRFASWMCSRQICRNCVMLSCQYGPKSLRNVSNILLNLFHGELRQFWRKKGVQPGTSKVYLIKWPVRVIHLHIKHLFFFSQVSIFIVYKEMINVKKNFKPIFKSLHFQVSKTLMLYKQMAKMLKKLSVFSLKMVSYKQSAVWKVF